jgi:hypothetical protein
MERLAGRIPTMGETQARTRSKTFTLSGTFLGKRAWLGGLGKARVHKEKLHRRAKWRLAKAKQRAAKRAIEIAEAAETGTAWAAGAKGNARQRSKDDQGTCPSRHGG